MIPGRKKSKFKIFSDKQLLIWKKFFLVDHIYNEQEIYDLMCKYEKPIDYIKDLK